jgi:hypothetical protein
MNESIPAPKKPASLDSTPGVLGAPQYAILSHLLHRPVAIHSAMLGPDGQVSNPEYFGVVICTWMDENGEPLCAVARDGHPIAVHRVDELTVLDADLELQKLLEPVRDVRLSAEARRIALEQKKSQYLQLARAKTPERIAEILRGMPPAEREALRKIFAQPQRGLGRTPPGAVSRDSWDM